MKKLLMILFIGVACSVQAQVTISGEVKDSRGKGISGVNIAIKDSYDGAITDSLGKYSFTTTETGRKLLQATKTNFKVFEDMLDIANVDIVKNFNLKPEITEMQAVVISAGSFEASDKNKGAVLTALDIVTTASANGDVTEAFKSLPGTQQVGESEGLFVRGGTATESKIYIDGNLVNNFFYASTPGIATRGRFNPFLFKGTIFSTGGYSALYGQALSSALILESVDLPERTQADVGISVVGVGGGIQKLAKDKKSSWGISANYTHLGLAFAVNKQKQDYFTVPKVFESDANFRIKTKGGFIKYFGYMGDSRVGFRMPDIDSTSFKNTFSNHNINTYNNLTWKERLGKRWKISTGISLGTNKDDIQNELQNTNNQKEIITTPQFYAFKNFDVINQSQFAQARLVLEKKLKGISALRFGTDYFYSKEKTTFTLYTGQKFTETVTDNLKAVFAETDIYITNDLALKAGTRVEHSQIIDKWNIAPRLSVAYKFKDNSQASFAYGIFYQNPERKLLPNIASIDYAKAIHYILQYAKLTKNYTFRTEVFFKKYDNLFKTGFNSNGREVAANNNGFGDAKGFELFWRDKKTLKNVDYWISYSYLDTKRDFLNFPKAIQPSFVANHTAAFVFKRFVLPWKTGFNLSYNFATGRPYYRIAYNNALSKYEITNEGKTINYNSMSFSVNYLPNLGKTNKKTFAVWVLGINNVLGQQQIFNYNFSNDGSRKEAITNPSKRFAFIGLFLSFGIDRTQDAINNNL
ncbi:MAG: TonB-dependent receptor [Ferruginibacter sp.]|nr:TonB-dependent receptor [Ferruginibacter sp.]